MNKTLIITVLALLLAPLQGFAHDEGHGPKLADVGLFGGIVSAVLDKTEASKGAKAKLIFNAELVRSEDGTVRVYLYDQKMKFLSLKEFEKSAKAYVVVLDANDKDTKTPFPLELKGRSFIGNAPKPSKKPFNIDVHFKTKDKTLLVAFDNLD
jgi:hypothetical protein